MWIYIYTVQVTAKLWIYVLTGPYGTSGSTTFNVRSLKSACHPGRQKEPKTSHLETVATVPDRLPKDPVADGLV